MGSISAEATKALPSPVLVVGSESERSSALGTKSTEVPGVVESQVRVSASDHGWPLKSHWKITQCSRGTVLYLHRKVLLSPLGQQSRQLVVESFRLADARALLAFPIRVEVASWSILGAEVLRGCRAKTSTSPAFSFFARSHAPSPPAGTTLGLHLLDDPVVGHHLDVDALLVVVDDLPLHQATVGRDLFHVGRRRFLVAIHSTENVEAA